MKAGTRNEYQCFVKNYPIEECETCEYINHCKKWYSYGQMALSQKKTVILCLIMIITGIAILLMMKSVI
ncbi:MAG: hypothetical protein R6V50_02225 [Thermoplasmatota archaeon]